MNRISGVLFCLIVLAAPTAQADEGAPQTLPSENMAADQSPRYLPRDGAPARPLESAEPVATETAIDASQSAARPNGPVPKLRSAERLTSGGEESPPRPIAPAAAESRAAMLLVPPTAEARPRGSNSEMPALMTGAASLAIVVGLFLVAVWAVRRGLPKGAGLLPSDALEVLGRAPLVGKQQVHLVRCGNKLILVCVCGLSVQTLTEITDPAEVERLSELCHAPLAGGSTGFAGVFKQFSTARERSYYSGRSEPDFGALDSEISAVRGSLA